MAWRIKKRGMEHLYDLDKAIICSITERSLTKINDYFKCSSFGVKHLNSKTLSILLRSLEKDKSNEDNAVNVKCVLNCLNKFLESKRNSKNWERLSENISKICEVCFCISLKLDDKELIELNIMVLNDIIQINNKLTNHIFQYLLDPCLTALCSHCRYFDYTLLIQLSNITSSLCENTSRMKRNEVVPMVTHHLNMLSNLITFCGDYEIQAAIVEVIARCKCSIVPSITPKGPNGPNLFSNSTLLGEQFNKYSFVKFDPECRMFLNTLNESLGDKRQVYSVPCICVVHNFITLKKPNDPSYKSSFWVDFNIASKRISFYHELPDTNWSIEYVPFHEIKHVIINDSVCITKHAKQHVDSVKVELSLCCENEILPGRGGLFGSLKLYCRKTEFDFLNRVLSIVFPTMKQCEIDPSLKADIGLLYSIPVQLIASTPSKELSNPKKTNTLISPPTSKSVEFRLALLKQNTQQKSKQITSPTEKQDNKREPFNENSSNVSEAHSNYELSPNIVGTKMPCSFDKNNDNITPNEVICEKHENGSIIVHHDIEKLCEMPKKPSLINTSLYKTKINNGSKHPADLHQIDNKECRVKRKRLYSNENEDISVKSFVLSSQDEQQPLNLKKSPNKKPRAVRQINKKDFFRNKNNKRRRKNKRIHLFTDEISSDDSIPCLISEKRKKGKELTASSFQSSSDSDYKPTCVIKETECKVPNKRLLRKRNNPFNTTIKKDKSGPCLIETNMDFPVPRKLKKYESRLGPNSVTNNFTTANTGHLPTSYIHGSNYTMKIPSKESQDFLNTIDLSKLAEPIRDETHPRLHTRDDWINAIQPGDSEILPKKFKTYETACGIENQTFVPVDFDLANSSNLANGDELSASQSKFNSKRLSTGHPISLWNMTVDDMSVGVHSDSVLYDMHLKQSTFKVDDILELSQKSVLNLKNNIKTSLIQSQAKRRQHWVAYDEQLKNASNCILESCERLEVNCSKLNKLKVSLDETLDTQHNLIIKIQSEMANLKEAKEQSLKNETEINKSETVDIMNIFKSIGTYVRRLLFTSFRKSALAS